MVPTPRPITRKENINSGTRSQKEAKKPTSASRILNGRLIGRQAKKMATMLAAHTVRKR